jgi:ligand-binding sensor domain-containing protein
MKKLSIILFLFLSSILSSQTWTNNNLKELNLYSKALYDLDIDSKQNIWVASLSGLLKYDGTSWTVYDTSNSDLPHNELFAVGVGKEDNVWVGHTVNYGVSIYDGTNWTNYNKNNSIFDPYEVRDIVFDKNNNPWFGSWKYIWTLENDKWKNIRHREEDDNIISRINEIVVDKNNDIWFTTSYDGIYSYKFGKLNNYKFEKAYFYEGLSIDSNNNIWFFNSEEILVNLYNETKKYIFIDTNTSSLNTNHSLHRKSLVDKQNKIWIIEERSLHGYNPETKLWKTYTAHDSLYSTEEKFSFTDFKLDENGNFWFITAGAGVFKLSDVITDIEVEPNINGISIYPNPASSLLFYETNNITSIIQQSIIDLSGKEVIKDNIDNAMRNSIDVSKLQPGIYFLQLTDMKGVKYSKKFVIEK